MLLLIVFVSSKILPNGINLYFNKQIIKYLILLSLIISFLFFAFHNFANANEFRFIQKISKITFMDLTLLLLPMGIVFQYIVFNFELLTHKDLILFAIKSLFVCIMLIIIIPNFLSVF